MRKNCHWNAQAEQLKAVQELANRVVEKETRLVELTKKLNATTKKVERRKRKVRDFFRFSLTIVICNFHVIILVSLHWEKMLASLTELFIVNPFFCN